MSRQSLICLFTLALMAQLHGETALFYDQATAGQMSGLTADTTSQVTIRDTLINPLQRDQANGLNEEVAVQQRRTLPALQAHALISFDGWIGAGANQVATGSAIINAMLYLDLTQLSGAPAVTLMGLHVSDANWSESQATANNRETGTAWTGGSFESALSGTYGSLTAPTASGRYGIDITDAIRDYLDGTISGLVLVGSSDSVADPRNYFFDARTEVLTINYTPVPEPLGAGLLVIGVSVLLLRRRRMGGIACLLFLMSASMLKAETTWVLSGNNAEALIAASGVPGQCIALPRTQWRDTQLVSQQPHLVLGTTAELAVQQPRNLVRVDGTLLVSWGALFGSQTNQIPLNAVIDGAWLWGYVGQSASALVFRVRGIPAADADWVENRASALTKGSTTSWSQGSFSDSLVDDYGTASAPLANGWTVLGGNIGQALSDLQSGRIGGVAFEPVGGRTDELRACYISSKEAESPAQKPALLIAWHLPAAPVSILASATAWTHAPTAVVIVSAPDAGWVKANGKRAEALGNGEWRIELPADGQSHEVLAGNALEESSTTIVSRQCPLKISRMDVVSATGKKRMKLTWTGLQNQHYVVEGCATLEQGSWQELATTTSSADGEISVEAELGEATRFYRLRAP